LALVGVVNLPIIKFSVVWWNTLHQPASLLRRGGPTIALPMLIPLLVMALAFALLFATLLLLRMQTLLIERKALAIRLNVASARRAAVQREGAIPAHVGAGPAAHGDGR
jgi:heme exporter protein C